MRYRFWLICINYNFDFLVLYKMYFQNYFARRSIILESFTSHLQHERPCCIRYTNSRLRLEFVYLIQHGRSCCKYYINISISYIARAFIDTVLSPSMRYVYITFINKIFKYLLFALFDTSRDIELKAFT